MTVTLKVYLKYLKFQIIIDFFLILVFEDKNQSKNGRDFFYDLISVISDLKFSNSGRFIITRDYMTIKVWDLNMDRQPLETYFVHEYLRGKLCTMYENDYIFDKFECSVSGNDK